MKLPLSLDHPEQYRLIFESANEAIVVTQNHKLVLFNAKTVELLGYSASTLRKAPLTKFIHPADVDLVKENLQKLQGKENHPALLQIRIINKAGKIKWILANAVLIKWKGNPAFLSFATDITAQKLTEIALKESEEKYKRIVESASDAILIYADDIINFVNIAAVKMFGFGKVSAIVGRKINEIINPDYIQNFNKRTEQLMNRNKVQFPVEEVFLRQDGSSFPAEVYASLLLYDGKPAIQIVLRDITERKAQQLALEQSERKWRELFEKMRDGWAAVDKDYKFTEYNQALLNMLGYTIEEMRQKSGCEIIPTRWHQYMREIVDDTFAKQGYTGILEAEFIRKDGTIFPIEISAYPIKDKNGLITGIWGMVRDITEQKNARGALTVSEFLHRMTIANVSDAVFLTDDDGQFVVLCTNYSSIFGYSREEVLQLGHVFKLLGTQLFKLNQLKEKGEIRNIECTIQDKNGQPHILLVNVKRVAIGDGTVLYSCRDITERKIAEKALRESEERYRLLVELSPDAIAFHQDGKIIFMNQAAVDQIGATNADECIGQPALKWVHHDYHEMVKQRIAKMIQEDSIAPLIEEKFIKMDGTILDVEVAASSFQYRGKTAVMVVVRNVTDRKQAEKQLNQKLVELERFNRTMVGRENRMIELKAEVNALRQQLGLPEKYKTPDKVA
jgi:PAS domain S-box-containing protein